MGPNQANIKAVITADDRASRALKGFGDNANGVSRSVGKAAKVASVALLAVGTAAVAFGVKSVKAYSESENTASQLNATLAATKGVAGVTARAALGLAASLQKVTRFSDEQILSGENLLLTFTNIGKNIFPRATKAMLDMSTTMKQDVSQSAIQLGKALQSPMAGMAALSRTGALNRDDMDRLKAKWERVGTPVYKQQIELLEALEKQFKGSSVAAGKTFAGQLDILKNQFDEVQESIGKVIVTALIPLGRRLADFVGSDKFQDWLRRFNAWFAVAIPQTITYFTKTIWPQLVSAFNTIKPVIQAAFDVLKALFKFIQEHTWIVTALALAFLSLKVQMALSGAAKAFAGVMAVVRAEAALTAGAGGIGKVRTAIGLLRFAMASPLVLAVAVGFALTQIKRVFDALNQLKRDYDAVGRAQNTINSAISQAHAQYKAGKITKSHFQKILQGSRASGGPVMAGGPYLVGERGPEVFVPERSGNIVPNNKLSAAPMNITIQAGVFMGSQLEARKAAEMIMRAYKDLAASKNMTPSQMLG